jgi:hypothetical protein
VFDPCFGPCLWSALVDILEGRSLIGRGGVGFLQIFRGMNEKALAFHFSNPNLSVGCFRCFGSIGVVDKQYNCFGGVR